MKRNILQIFLIISLIISTIEVVAAGTSTVGWIEGTVTDPLTGSPLVGATVTAEGHASTTDENGNYAIEVEAGTYNVTASAEGYWDKVVKNVNVTASITTIVNFTLSKAVISVKPTTITAWIGETFTVNVTITDVFNLYMWEVHISFDPDVLECTGVLEGPFLKSAGSTSWGMMQPKIDNVAGTIKATDILWTYPPQGATGDGVLCNITFIVKDVGRTTLNFSKTELWTWEGSMELPPIEHEAMGGFFTNVHDMAITDVTASPTSVAVGESVDIDVTVANEGDFPETFNVIVYWKIGNIYSVIETREDLGLQSGTNETLSPPFTWTPTASGNYTIHSNLTVLQSTYNPYGIDTDPTDNTFKDVIVEVIGVVASFTASPVIPLLNEEVTFNASASYDPDGGNIVTYEWNFGDGTTATENDPLTTHTYTEPGEWSVVLTVTDDEGEKGFSDQLIRVIAYPVAFFTYSPESPLKNRLVTFNASLSDPKGGTIDHYAWDFGDSNTNTTYVPIVTHVYTAEGTYKVNLTVTDSEGLTNSTTHNVTVSIKHDVAVVSVSYTPSTVYAGQWVGIDIVVRNEGTETETFNVTVYLDDTLIETIEVANLAPLNDEFVRINKDTTGLPAGNYTIKAEASTVPNETEVDDNKATTAMFLNVADLAITNVMAYPTTVLASDKLNVSVTVRNEGTVTPDIAPNVYIYLTNATHSDMEIITLPITGLTSGTEKTNWKTWDITDASAVRISPGTYSLSAFVSPITGAGGKEIESDLADNTYTYGNVIVGASLISIYVNPPNITIGSSTTINGSIMPVRSGVNVTIRYQLSGEETWNILETVTTGENSTYSYDWRPQTKGTYKVKATWEGDKDALPSESETLTITVSSAPSNVFLYVAAAAAIIVIAAIAIYLLRLRKPKTM